MKNIYDALNDTGIKAEDYQVRPATELEKATMKRDFKKSIKKCRPHSRVRWAAVAACAVCAVGFSQTAFAKTLVDNIIKSVNIGGGVSIVQNDPSKTTPKYQFYDKNGNKITLKSDGTPTDVYDKNGKCLGCIGGSKNDDSEIGTVKETDWNNAAKQLSFKALIPCKLPAGYSFDHASLYLDDNGKPSGDYVDIYYINGSHKISIHERRLTKGTAYTGDSDESVTEVKVNGNKAALQGGHDLTWNKGNVNIGIVAKDLSSNDLMSFAESMK